MHQTVNQAQPRAELLKLFAYRAIDFVSGENASLRDRQGREYTDLASGHGVAAIGHCHPGLRQALNEQSRRLVCCPGSFGNDLRQELAQAIWATTPRELNRFFFCNSGTEAVEAALKMALLSSPQRKKLIAFRGGFHGRTLGALGLTFNPKYRQPFAEFTPRAEFLPYNDLAAVREALDDSVCAVMVEPILGEGGVHPGTKAFLAGLTELCQRHGSLLILDEVQTGGGRTGQFWALEESGIVPDILCFAKALGGGFPFGGIACGPRISESPGSHGSTYGGNPLACAAALATLKIISEEGLCRAAREKGELAMKVLQNARLPVATEIRGRGLMIGLELNCTVTPILSALQKHGVIALAAGPRVLRLLPPLTIPIEQLQMALEIVVTVLGEKAS